MICVMTNKIVRGEIENTIIKWEVWFRTPFGVCKDIYEARKLMQDANLDPRMTIVPVAVAIGHDTHEIYIQ